MTMPNRLLARSGLVDVVQRQRDIDQLLWSYNGMSHGFFLGRLLAARCFTWEDWRSDRIW
jgi:hypothetical protein